MMRTHTITVRNVNYALEEGLWALKMNGVVTTSRNGRVVRVDGPVVTTYQNPEERVLFSAKRDANPFFHLYECVWMLAGKDDVASVARYAKHMETFGQPGADGELIMMGAYGQRWRDHFGFDQLEWLIKLLSSDPSTRRAVLGMWSPNLDLLTAETSKDVPCNTHVYFDATQGRLDMTVCNRSNDIVWGAYGANAVHMSFLQEFIALSAGLKLGAYHQFSNNYHLYIDRDDTKRLLRSEGAEPKRWDVLYTVDNRYVGSFAPHFPIKAQFTGWKDWLAQAEGFAERPHGFHGAGVDPFFHEVFSPMMTAHAAYKAEDFNAAKELMVGVQAADWRTAGLEWLERREQKRLGRVTGGAA